MADNSEKIVELQSWFKLSEDQQNPWRTQGQEDLEFYLGKQWKAADKEILSRQKRPALTFNHIRPLINLISGYQRQNRQDIKVYNKKGGTREVAEILTAIIKHSNDYSLGDFETSIAFLLGIISAKAYLGVTLDYDDDPYNGELRIENTSPFQVYPDPYSERYDFSDASFIFKTVWLPRKKIELIYPDKKEELESMEVDTEDKVSITEAEPRHETYATGSGKTISEIDKWKYRVKQCFWREYETQTFIYDLYNGVAKRTDLNNEQLKRLLARAPNFRKIKKVTPKMRLSTYVGSLLLEDMEPYVNRRRKQYGLKRFPIVPFYPYWIEGTHTSVVTPLKDPQQEINKRYSQMLHHLNQSANSGWIGDPQAVVNWEELEEMGTKPGVTIKLKPGKQYGKDVTKIDPSVLSEGHLILMKEGGNQVKVVSGVNTDLLGMTPEKHESGFAMQLRQRQGLVSLEPILDNFRITKQLLGRVLIEMIQKSGAYSKEEVIRIVIDNEEKEYKINQKRMFGIGRALNDLTVGTYDCTVGQAPSSPTARMARFYSLIEAVKAGIPIPPTTIIKSSDIPEKEEVLQGIAKQEEAQQEAAQAEQGMKQEEVNIKKGELALKVKEAEIKGNIELLKAEKEKSA